MAKLFHTPSIYLHIKRVEADYFSFNRYLVGTNYRYT